MEMSRGLLVLVVLFVAGVVAQFDDPNFDDDRERDLNANFDFDRNRGFDARNQDFDNRNRGFDNRNPNFDNRNPNFDNRNPNFDNRNPNFDARNQGFDARNQGFDTRNQGFDNRNRDFGRDRDFGREREQPPRNAPPPETVSACRGKEADVFFILDSSSSIYIEDYELQRQFVREVVGRLDVQTQYTRVGALTFSDNYQVSFGLQDYSNKQDLRNAINDRNIPYLTGLTNTADAIRYVRTNGQFRPDKTRVIVVVTDGYSRQPGQTSAEAEQARREGFYMFVIGVGQYTDEREWRSIANDPDHQFMYNITNYRGLDRLYDTIPNRLCVLPPIIINSGTCGVRENADIVFVAGPGEASNAFTTVNNLISNLQDDFGRLRVSMLLNDCKANEVPLTDPSLFCTNFGDETPSQDSYSNLLKEMRAQARDGRGVRPQANQVAILFINQNSMDQDRFGIYREARDAQYDGIDVIVVDLGVGRNNQNFLSRIASDQEKVFSTSGQSVRELERMLLGKACDSINDRPGLPVLPTPS